MKAAFRTLLGLTVLFVAVATINAAGEKVTLKGTITCAKCDLKKESKCATVIVVNEKGKDVIYYFDAASHKKHHKPICTTAKKGTVTGTVSEKGGKKVITVSEVKFD